MGGSSPLIEAVRGDGAFQLFSRGRQPFGLKLERGVAVLGAAEEPGCPRLVIVDLADSTVCVFLTSYNLVRVQHVSREVYAVSLQLYGSGRVGTAGDDAPKWGTTTQYSTVLSYCTPSDSYKREF